MYLNKMIAKGIGRGTEANEDGSTKVEDESKIVQNQF